MLADLELLGEAVLALLCGLLTHGTTTSPIIPGCGYWHDEGSLGLRLRLR